MAKIMIEKDNVVLSINAEELNEYKARGFKEVQKETKTKEIKRVEKKK